MKKNKVAVVTGANGFVGTHLVAELLNNNYTVYSIVRPGRYNNIEGYCTQIIECDLDDIVQLPLLIEKQEEAVFYHLAWEGSSGDKRKDYNLQLTNAMRTVEAAKAAAKIGCKTFISAGSVTQLLYRDYLRQDNINPEMVTCYAIGKMTAEALLKCVCPEINLDLCWCYISNFYGEDDSTKNFINFLVDSYLRGNIPILTPATQLADFMHVSDVARALMSLDGMVNGIQSLYVGYGNPRPLRDFVEIIHNKTNPTIEMGIGLKPFEGRSVDYSIIDYLRINRLTGFTPKICFEDGINLVVEARKNMNN